MALDFSKVDPDNHPGKNWNKDGGDKEARIFSVHRILRTEALEKYVMETSVYPREHKALTELRQATNKHAWSALASTGDVAQLIGMLLKLLNAKNTIELGVFTGYSLLATALALPQDGKVIAVDTMRDSYNIGVPYIEAAGVAHKIDFREGKCADVLDTLLSEEKHLGFFDFAFVDADKGNYMNYHQMLLKLVRVGGIIAYDNTLWGGFVADDEEKGMPESFLYYKPIIQELNKYLAADPRIEISHLSIGDGLTLCKRIV